MNFFVTGGSRGVGAAMVRDLAKAGHDIAFTYNANRSMADDLVAEIKAAHPDRTVLAFQLDQRDSSAVEAVVEKVTDAFFDVDAVILNAAANRPNLAASMSDEEWGEVIDVNLTGTFYVCREFIPQFLSQKRGRFIHISSIAYHGMSGLCAYSASKAGLNGLSASLAKEYGRKGITSNVLTLGYFETDMSRDLMQDWQRDFWQQYCPIGRTGDLAEVSAAVLYLASDGAGIVNGANIPLTGGLDWGT